MIDGGILTTLRELRYEFDKNFDQSWFFLIIETLPISVRTMREIRELFEFETIGARDIEEIQEKSNELEKLLHAVRDFLLPRVKEKLSISHLDPEHMIDDKEQKLLRRFVASNLPFNLERMCVLTAQLKNDLKLYQLRITPEPEELPDANVI
ncbi:MAG: hypothetical protein P8107_09875 [Spirochaetia bacterium]|jgi:hypothetical protein